MVRVEITARFLEDHARLRGKSEVLEALALRILRGDEDLGSALRLKGEEIQKHLQDHMDWEEAALLPMLRSAPGGREVAVVIAAEHATQRDRLAEWLAELSHTDVRPTHLARTVLDLTRWLAHDMAVEERTILDTLRRGGNGTG